MPAQWGAAQSAQPHVQWPWQTAPGGPLDSQPGHWGTGQGGWTGQPRGEQDVSAKQAENPVTPAVFTGGGCHDGNRPGP
jgi:hypothetical protein